MTARVRVAVRCRPLVEKEINEGCESCLTVIDEAQVLLGKDKCFTYDYAFDPAVSQEDVFQSCGYPLIEAIFKGFNATMLAYGQTGSGKTYTMGSGKIVESSDEDSLGIIPRVVEYLFSMMKDREEEYEYLTKVSFLEIYNEEIKDLLSNPTDNQPLTIREDINGIKIAGLTEREVRAPTEALNLLCQGGDFRATGSTKMNETSSRSHAIFTLTIQQQSKSQSEDNWCAKFHLVDLAGSERIKKTGAEGDRRKEGININLGLLALGNVVSALGDDKRKKTAHIPYRDSKLTRLLQDSLGGNSYTLMMACTSPADSNMEETLNTLRYADRARRIKNKPIINRDPHVAEILRLKALVAQLQSDAVCGQLSTDDPISSLEYRKLKEKSDLLEEQNEKLANELTNAIDHSNDLCEKIVLMEMSRDKLKARLHKITVETGLSVDEVDNSLKDSELTADVRERLERVKAIQQEIVELDKDKASLECTLSELHDHSLTTITEMTEDTQSTVETNTSTLTPSSDMEQQVGNEDIDVYAKTYTLHRAKMSRQLKDLNDMLTAKEQQVEESVTAEQKRESFKHQQALEKKIKALEDEKEKLSQQVTSSKSSAAIGKISEQRRQRLKELEQQMGDLKRKLKEQSRIVKMKEQSDKQLEKLNKEIVTMRQQRVRLMRQIKEESENFRKWKMEQDKKMLQMKAKERKRECEVAKMELQHARSQAFYKRKAEEAAMANKRLKESLERQKVSRERHSSKVSEKDMSSIGPRVKSLVNDEIDMMVSIREAERHLQDQQAQRAELHKHLKSLKATISTGLNGEADEQSKIYQTQLSLCSAAISDFNLKLQDAKGTKTQPLSERLSSMVEARCAIRHLLNLSVKYKLETLVSESSLKETSSTANSSSKQIAELERELAEMEDYHYHEMKVMTNNFDRKMATMKGQLEKQGANVSDLDVQSMQLDVTALNEEIEEKNLKIAELERKLEDVSRLAAQTPHHKSNTPKSGLPGERFPHLGIVASPFTDKVTVSAKQPADTKLKMKTKATRVDNKLIVTSKIKSVPEDESMITDFDDDASDIENDDPADLSWHATPEIRRMRRMSSFTKCSCTTKCRTQRCGCRVKNTRCGPLCGCKLQQCTNTQHAKNESSTSPNSNTLNTTYSRGSNDNTLASETGAMNTTFNIDKSASTDSDSSFNGSKGSLNNSEGSKKYKRESSSSSLKGGKKKKMLTSSNTTMYFGSPV